MRLVLKLFILYYLSDSLNFYGFSLGVGDVISNVNTKNKKFFENLHKDGINIKELCLEGYIKAFYDTNTTRYTFPAGPSIILSFERCYPAKPLCVSRRDTIQLKHSNNQTQYYRFGCRSHHYWKQCENNKTERSAVFCSSNLLFQIFKKNETTTNFDVISYFESIFKNPTVSKTSLKVSILSDSMKNNLEEEFEKEDHETSHSTSKNYVKYDTEQFFKFRVFSFIMVLIGTIKVFRIVLNYYFTSEMVKGSECDASEDDGNIRSSKSGLMTNQKSHDVEEFYE
ncbi:unnamed protein product [Caenorhabditis angaria]|uniref:Uncharacterized protein n=1 Tax=Caenorhabditis angaria TaxID=860376 RepID=A0A9P1N805_9PELO|nr:unnamed protein product [Caenorhabditis angaria]